MTDRLGKYHMTLIGVVVLVVAVGSLSAWFLVNDKPVTMPMATCGSAGTQHGASGPVFREWNAGALACFRQAAMTCHDASLRMTDTGVDIGTYDVIALHRTQSACTARVTEQSYSLQTKTPIFQFTCNQVHVDDNGEQVACDNGESFSIPRRTSAK